MKYRPTVFGPALAASFFFLGTAFPAAAQSTTYLRGRVQTITQASGQLPVSGTATVTACE